MGAVGMLISVIDGVCMVCKLAKGSPAEKAGIRVGQRVLAVNGDEISGKSKQEVAFKVCQLNRRDRSGSGTVDFCCAWQVRGEGGEKVHFSILDTLPMPKGKVGQEVFEVTLERLAVKGVQQQEKTVVDKMKERSPSSPPIISERTHAYP